MRARKLFLVIGFLLTHSLRQLLLGLVSHTPPQHFSISALLVVRRKKKETRKKAGNLMFILMENSHLVFNLNFFYLFPALLVYDEDVGRRNCSPIWLLLLVVRNNFSSCCKGKRPAIGRGKTIFSSALRNVSQFIYFVLFFFSHFN